MKLFKTFLIALTLTLGANSFAAEKKYGGDFFTVTPGDDVEGSIQIHKTKEGKKYLILNNDFMSVEGPALYVVLHKQVVPESYTRYNYVNLGKLRQFEGAQVYEIPSHIDLEDFKAAIIWCKEFDVTFGSAEFEAH